jgi:hypothetical protein
MTKNVREDEYRERKKTNWTIMHNKFPPTPRVGLVWPRPHRPALILLFAKKFFRLAFAGRMRWTGQIFWLLAYDAWAWHRTFFPPSLPKTSGNWPKWEVVSSYSSATAPDSHGISCADPLFTSSQRTGTRSSGLRFERQDYLITCHAGAGV